VEENDGTQVVVETNDCASSCGHTTSTSVIHLIWCKACVDGSSEYSAERVPHMDTFGNVGACPSGNVAQPRIRMNYE